MAVVCALGTLSGNAWAMQPEHVEFDRESLRARGLDPALADLFREAPRFAPGAREVRVQVNGKPRGRAVGRFNEQGQLRVDAAFLHAVRLHVTDAFPAEDDEDIDITSLWPQAVVRLVPSQLEVELVLPAEALADPDYEVQDYQRGGAAAILNYDLSSTSLQLRGQTVHSYAARNELGFNAADWIVRSAHSLSHNQGSTRSSLSNTYAQRSLYGSRKLLRVGEIDVASPLFSSPRIIGLQVQPEQALLAPQADGSALVEGIASSEARVEIRQAGSLLHSTLLPPGPFALSGFALRDVSSDLEVTLYEDSGERRFFVPATTFRRASLAVPGTTFAAGRIQDRGSLPHARDDSLVTASTAWRALRGAGVGSAGVLLSEHYLAAAFGLDRDLGGGKVASLRSTGAWAPDSLARGLKSELRVDGSQGPFTASLSAFHRTPGYREISELAVEPENWARSDRWQLSTGLGWNSAMLGSFGATFSPRESFSGARAHQYGFNWSRQVARATVSLSMQKGQALGTRDERAAYLSVSVPLDRLSVRASARSRENSERLALDLSGRATSASSWRASLERDLQRADSGRVSAGFTATPRYAQVGLSGSSGAGLSTLNAQVSGGLVMHSKGLSFSPRRIQDTFGIARIGNNAGIRINAGGGDAWTDFTGRAVLPDLAPFRQSGVDVVSRSLPRDVDLQNGTRQLQPGRGSVSHVEFPVSRSRAVLARVTTTDGHPINKGTSVSVGGHFATAVVDDGHLYLPDFDPALPIQLNLADGAHCTLTLQVKPADAAQRRFARAAATCVPQ